MTTWVVRVGTKASLDEIPEESASGVEISYFGTVTLCLRNLLRSRGFKKRKRSYLATNAVSMRSGNKSVLTVPSV